MNFRSSIRQRLFSWMGAPFYRYGHQTFSQAGEDCIARFLFLDYGMKLEDVTYLDIGSRHPTAGSNTCLFYAAGGHGVCVDADPTFIPLFKQLRPRDAVLNVGVTDTPGEPLPLYLMAGGGSTLSKDEADRRVATGTAEIIEVLTVPVTDINTLIRQQFLAFPTFLSIDVETLDLPVLKSLDFQTFPIPVICAETCAYAENHVRGKDRAIENFLQTKGYDVYADTYINTLFVNRQWFNGSTGHS